MQIEERLVVPGLGIVILLSAFILGVPLVYQLLLGLLGLAAAGTYFAPSAVQVETRIAIAALGLIILLIVSSTAFWLILLSFGAIAAMQFPHRHTLQRNPVTITWLSTVPQQLRRAGPTGLATPAEADAEAEAEPQPETARTGPQAPSAVGTLPPYVRVNVAGIAGLVVGVLVLVSIFMPWFGFLISGYGQTEDGPSLTLRAAASELELPALGAFFYILIVLGVTSIASIALPRIAAAIIAAAGLAATLASYIHVVAEVERAAEQLSSAGVSVIALPAGGALIAGLCFLVLFVLQLIPRTNRPIS